MSKSWFFLHGTVDEVKRVSQRMRRIRIADDELRDIAWNPGQHIRLRVGGVSLTRGLRDLLRTYSIWDYDPSGWLDLCILDHENAGPGAIWSRHARAGQRVALTKPEGRFVLRDDAPYHVFIGDETASVAFGAMLRAVPAGVPCYGAIDAKPGDRLALPRGDELTWGSHHVLDLPEEPGVAYVAGEARVCQAVRTHLIRERGWPRKNVVVKPFWVPGKTGLD